VLAPSVLVEFYSLLRKLVVRGRLEAQDAADIAAALLLIPTIQAESTGADAIEGFRLAARLGQSDTFDATGYVVARRHGTEFWVSDRRFANAAATARLPGVRFIG
jgi:predicted nucleic acid-binding protein